MTPHPGCSAVAEEVISHRPGIGAADPALTGAQLADRVYSQYVWDKGDLIGRHNHFQ